MRVMHLLLFIIIAINLIGCAIGPATYEVFAVNRDVAFGDKISRHNISKKKEYDEYHYIYIVEYPKGLYCTPLSRPLPDHFLFHSSMMPLETSL